MADGPSRRDAMDVDAICKRMGQNHLWVMPVAAETYDGVLNDINGRHVTSAIRTAKSVPVNKDNACGGVGMICSQFKGGAGTSSRKVQLDGDGFVVGALPRSTDACIEK